VGWRRGGQGGWGRVSGVSMLDSAPPTAGKRRRINPPYEVADKSRCWILDSASGG
jgi:hypothetical protein